MGLQSSLSTALTGMNAAETAIDVVGNNVANANTVGFKQSKVSFATQFLQTQSIGSGPTESRGGTNPRQIGLGAKVAEIAPQFTQGTIEISSSPLDIAIQGDGFFIVQGPQGEQMYTRNGQFKTNSDNEIVTITGQRVLGFGVDENFTVRETELVPINIPLGAAAVAQPTGNVFMGGALDPSNDVGSVPEIIESVVLSNGAIEFPSPPSNAPITLASLARPLASTTVGAGGAGSVDAGVFSYRVAFVDGDGNEGPPSDVTSNLTLASTGGSINLGAIPQPASGSEFTQIRLYRNNSSADTNYRQLATLAAGTTTYNDAASDASISGNPTLNANGLGNGSYSYYVTFYKSSGGEESRPTARFGPVTIDATTSPRIRLDSLPVPTTANFDGIRIYRNLANDQNNFYLVDQITPAELAAFSGDVSYIDSSPDSEIADNGLIDLEGPSVSFNTELVNVVTRIGSTYTNLFSPGTLSFSGSRADRQLVPRELTITSTTTIGDLITFMEDSMGIVKIASEDSFPTGAGGTIADSRLQFTSNMGLENALTIDRSAFSFVPAGGGPPTAVPLEFGSAQSAVVNGEGASADFVVYDSLGQPLSVHITTVLEATTSNEARFRWIATSTDNAPEIGNGTIVGTGILTTDGEGQFLSATNDTVTIDRTTTPAASPLVFNLDFSKVTGLVSAKNEISASRQDGFPAGSLASFIISDTGRIQGVFSNGASRDLGQIQMARFTNPSGLQQVGDNTFVVGVNSGLPIIADPGSQGIGGITGGAVELSNSDIGQNLIELILASTQYRGGARVITTVQQLLDELLALRR